MSALDSDSSCKTETNPLLHVQTPFSYGSVQREGYDVRTVEDESDVVVLTSERNKDLQRTATVCAISVVYVLCCALVRVLLPIYSASTDLAGGDAFTLLFHICLFFPVVLAAITILYKALWDRSTSLLPVGVRWSVLWLMGSLSLANGICSTFASNPQRTPPYLQGLLMTTRIPYTVVVRFILLRKGLSLRRLGCTIAVVIGIFITVEPQIWNLPGSGDSAAGGSSIAHVVWPLIFSIGFLPAAINTVICERELKNGEAQSLSFITWSQVFQLFTILPLFWVDFIPFFGMAKSFHDFGDRMHVGFKCNFSSEPSCNGLALKGWVFILGYCLANLFQFILIQKAEGAVFAVVVQAMVTPLATLFWTFYTFDPEQDHFFWNPQFNETTAFTLAGLVIIVPAVVLYNVFSREDARLKLEREKADENGLLNSA